MKPRKPISPISRRRSAKLAEYEKAKRKWRKQQENRRCCVGSCRDEADKNPHHQRGRLGNLLCAVEFWLPVCPFHHRWIHENVTAARRMGLICDLGKWNTNTYK